MAVCIAFTLLAGCTRWKALTESGDPRALMMPAGFYSIFEPNGDKKKREKPKDEDDGRKTGEKGEPDGPNP